MRLLSQVRDGHIAEVSVGQMATEQTELLIATRISFGPFELNLGERSLKNADETIPLGTRAFDILLTLIERAGEVVGKNELIAKVWPDVTVEEGSLRVHLSALRKALGDGQFGRRYITNVQGRGYSFVGPVMRQESVDHKRSPARLSNLPTAYRGMIGRDEVVQQIRNRLTSERLITVLGTGGIGKTTVASAVGHAASPDFAGAVFFVDLSVLRSGDQIVAAISSTMGSVAQPGDPEEALLEFLRSRRALLILDSCEHLIDEAAEIAERICQCAPDMHLLATSREALQIAGERVFRLQPLDCPPEQAGQTADEVLSYPAARLFMERLSARGVELAIGPDDPPFLAEICRRLDGIPLAIELAARRAAVFGIRDTALRLASHLDLQKLSRRTANRRHQTLRATLDWSHDLLSEAERAVLRRLAIFVGPFTLEAALTMAEREGVSQADNIDLVASLAEKSLIEVRIDAPEASYRLLDTTRAYALEKLLDSGELDEIANRHANYSIDQLEADCTGWKNTQRYKDYLGNIRAALDWSFGGRGSDASAIRLAAAAGPLFLAMPLLAECRDWMERAIDRMSPECDLQHQVEIHASFALSLMLIDGNSKKIRAAFYTALGLAERYDDAPQQLRLLNGLSMYSLHLADVASAFDVARRGEAVAAKTGSRDDAAIADCMLGTAYYLAGDHLLAQKHLEQALRDLPHEPPSIAGQYMFYPRSQSLMCLTRSHWLAGNLDRAVRYAETTVEEADSSEHPITLISALGMMMSLYFWIDDLQKIERNLAKFEYIADKTSFGPYRTVAHGLKGLHLLRTGRISDGMGYLRDTLESLAVRRYKMLVSDFAVELALCLAKQNNRAEALALVDDVTAGYRRVNMLIHLPALLLTKAMIFIYGDAPDLKLAEEYLQRSIAEARKQSTLSYELRAALQLARIWIGNGEVQRARDLIGPIYDRFSEGFGTPDLILAGEILGDEHHNFAHFDSA
jgi:predicted ATPase/DNA-binding winged helix-turn-helix (wHTH) protein